MALDTTIAGPNSDSYVTLVEADTYLKNQLYSSEWMAAESTTREMALRLATRRLDQERYSGVRASSTQRLSWPRLGAVDPDGYSNVDWGLYDIVLSATEIPQLIKDAQCLLALELMKSNILEDSTDMGNISHVALPGGLEVDFINAIDSGELPANVRRLLADLILDTSTVILRS